MFCTRCGNQLGDTDRFCSQCARPTSLANSLAIEPKRLTRDSANKKIAGVCAGFARYMDVDPVLIRVVWLALAFGAGMGFIGYLVAWIVMPKDTPQVAAQLGDFARYPG
jgi:phage shock protein C